MKKGYTTGSCAAAAAKAAAYMLLSGKRIERISIVTPAGLIYSTQLEETDMNREYVSCAVRKDAGDDPDITDKLLVFARVSLSERKEGERVLIDGGEGIGRVTRPGLDQEVGNAAINSVPRRMIGAEVHQVMELFDFDGFLDVLIYAPEGRRLAEKTFNPRLGIKDGISIIGTTGIVEPMSTKAILDTIRVELEQLKAEGNEVAVVSPGNYGLEFMKEKYDYDLDRAVKCSNFIGETIDMASEAGFSKMLLCGHAGKLVKLSGGIMNTHSGEADCRMELLCAAALRAGAKTETLKTILDCVTTEEATDILINEGIKDECFNYIMERTAFYLDKRAGGRIDVECLVYSKSHGLLGKTGRAEEFLREASTIFPRVKQP